ncbi:hypothetical protein D1007_32279 [Hordeum vulgare]|nr:hypothetical protein D1007_32279 [Hordeum vulgare]
MYFTTNIVVVPLEEDQELAAMKVEEDVVAMILRASEPGHPSMPTELDSDEEDETVVWVEEKTKSKAKATRRSNRLRGP